MAAKKSKSKTSTLSKQSKAHFKWYMAVILVAIVAVVGILVIRFSNAAAPGTVTAKYHGYQNGYDRYEQFVAGRSQGIENYNNLGPDCVVSIGSPPTRSYRVTQGAKYGQVIMTETPLAFCSG